jgi:hypothetical protein
MESYNTTTQRCHFYVPKDENGNNKTEIAIEFSNQASCADYFKRLRGELDLDCFMGVNKNTKHVIYIVTSRQEMQNKNIIINPRFNATSDTEKNSRTGHGVYIAHNGELAISFKTVKQAEQFEQIFNLQNTKDVLTRTGN